MKLYGYEAKTILNALGIPTPRGEVAANPLEAQEVVASLKPPFVVKAQVLVAGRGKASGVLFAEDGGHVGKAASFA